jgi:hypothetical protein
MSPSADQIQHLRLDRASETALQAFATLGTNDGISAYAACLREDDLLGKVLADIFNSIPEKTPST